MHASDCKDSISRGFLPSADPLRALPLPYYAPWEELICRLPSLLSDPTSTFSDLIRGLPILSTEGLLDESALQRAYVVLGFLTQGYIWVSEVPNMIVPPALAAPYWSVCMQLETKPALSYAGLCLWNWTWKSGVDNSNEMVLDGAAFDQLECLASFTGSRDEDAFYLVPVLVEACAMGLVTRMAGATAKDSDVDVVYVRSTLKLCSEKLQEMGETLDILYRYCGREFFYERIRPWLRGSKGLPDGVMFQLDEAGQQLVQVKSVGGSAAQSPLFQFLDTVLGVQHRSEIFEEMREYMPGQHRRFLQAASALPSLRAFVEAASDEPGGLKHDYNECINNLRSWRARHIAVVSRYIIGPSRKTSSEKNTSAEPQGTAGSTPMLFLREAKDETSMLSEQIQDHV